MSDGFVFVSIAAFVMNGVVVAGLQPIIMPKTSDFFEVHSVTAVREGDTAVMLVDRTIHKPIPMSFVVRVLSVTEDGAEQVCITPDSGVFEYQPDAVLPVPLTLGWWTSGHCPTLPDGPARIITTWKPDYPGLRPLTVTVEVQE